MLLFLFHNIPRTNHCPLNRTRTFPPFFPPAPVIRNKPPDPGTPNERPLHPARPHTRIALAVCPVSRLCHHPPPDPSGKPHLAPSTVLPLCFRLAPVLKSATIVRSLLFPVLSSFSCIHPELVFSVPVCLSGYDGGGYEFFGWFR